MITDDDLDACFSTDDFAQAAEITGLSSAVNGYFTEGTSATVMYGVAVEAVNPSFITKTEWVEDVSRGDALRTRPDSSSEWQYFIIEKIEVTGAGSTTLYLKTSVPID